MEGSHHRLYRTLKAQMDVLLRDVLQDFAVNQQRQVLPRLTVPIDVDFSKGHCRWPDDDEPVKLARALPTRMLEAFFRNPIMSLCRFLLVDREGEGAGYKGYKQILSDRRHALTMLRHMIRKSRLPVNISDMKTNPPRVRASFNREQIQANVLRAQGFAKKAVASLRSSDYAQAVGFAGDALAVDFDCTVAAWVIETVLKAQGHADAWGEPDHLTANVVLGAQICMARAILRWRATIRRLRKTCDPNASKATEKAKRLLKRAIGRWHVLRAWRFDSAGSERNAPDPTNEVKTFIELWIDAVLGDSFAVTRLETNRIIHDLVQDLLKNKRIDGSAREEIREALTTEVLQKLALKRWSPAPAESEAKFREQLFNFLYRRIDWEFVLGKREGGMAEFQDEVYEVDDKRRRARPKKPRRRKDDL